MRRKEETDKVVFVGNIAYHTTEDQLLAIFNQVGPVANLRLKFDPETGKPLGFGFVDFHDSESAASARRNLNGYELNGRRLRVDVPSQLAQSGSAKAVNPPSGANLSGAASAPKRPRTDSASSASSSSSSGQNDGVSSVIAGMSPAQVYQIVSAMKTMVDTAPDQARTLLTSNPQLAYAVLQAQVLLGMAPQLQQAARQRKYQEVQQQQQQQAHQQQLHMRLQQQLQQQLHEPMMQQQQQHQVVMLPTLTPELIERTFGGLDEELRTLLVRVLALTPEEINGLDAAEQQQALSLRQQAFALLRQAEQKQ